MDKSKFAEAISNSLLNHGARVALITESGDSWSYQRLANEAYRIAKEIPKSSLVVVEGDNSPATIASYLAVILSGSMVFMCGAGDAGALNSSFGPVVRIVCDGDESRICDKGVASEPGYVHPDLVLLFSTSGSTGTAKMVKITSENILSNTLSIVSYLDMNCDSRSITSLVPHYTFGLSVINSHLVCGGSLLLTNRSVQDPAFWEFARAHDVENFAGVPHTYEVLAHLGELEKTSSLKLLTQAGGKMRPELVEQYARQGERTGWRFCVMYGQTEASPRMAYLPPEMAKSAPSAIGIPIPGGSLALRDEVGEEVVAVGVEGELIYVGPNVMAGYATKRDDLRTADALSELSTGDLALKRSDGLYEITGRISRFIKPLGKRISLDDVERKVADFGWNAATVARGEGLSIVLEATQAGSLRKDLIGKQVSSELSVPCSLVSVMEVDRLPRLASGKIDYATLSLVHEQKKWIFSNALDYVLDTLAEAWRLFIHRANANQTVRQMFCEVFGGEVTEDDSFLSFGADSLSYVQLSLALEGAFGELPAGWIEMRISDLERVLMLES